MITTYSLSIYEKTKKVCLLLALLVAEVGSMNAQTSVTPDKYKVETNSFSSCPKQSCYCKRINKREKNVNIRVKKRVKENKSDEKNKMKFKEKDEKTFNDIKEQNDRQIVNY